MARKKQVQTRIATDTHDQLTEYQDTYDLSQADALRRLIRSGLEAEGHPVATTDGGTLQADIKEMQREMQRARTGTLAAVAYLTVVVLAPSTLPATLGLTVGGLLLAAGLWHAGMFDLPALRGETDE